MSHGRLHLPSRVADLYILHIFWKEFPVNCPLICCINVILHTLLHPVVCITTDNVYYIPVNTSQQELKPSCPREKRNTRKHVKWTDRKTDSLFSAAHSHKAFKSCDFRNIATTLINS
jgi:hypothetical protein